MPRAALSDESSAAAGWSSTDLERDPHRAADKADRVRNMFGAIAGAYDLNNRVHSFGRDQAWRRRTVALCRIGPGDRVLDVACGTGDLTEALADAGPASVHGVDFTPEMLTRAREKSARRRRRAASPEPTYASGDAMRLEAADGSFDVVTIAFGIRNVERPVSAIAEFQRVLSPGGRLAILEFSRPANRLVRLVSDAYTRCIMPRTATFLARDRSGAYRYLPRSVETFPDAEELAGLVRAAGFSDVRVVRMDLGICACVLGTKAR